MITLPEVNPKKIVFKLNQKAESSVRNNHPWIFEGSISLQKQEGKPGDIAIIFDRKKNSFLACGLYDPNSPIRIKVLETKHPVTIDKNWFSKKIKQAHNLRKPLSKTDTNSYRLIYGENDGLPGLIADVYNHVIVVKLYSEIWYPYLKELFPILLETSATQTMILRLSRNLQKSSSNYQLKDGQIVHGELKNEVIVFKEHGINFSANVIHGHKTGYFLDHRANRKRVGELSKNKTVLDVFSYAGGFSVHALAGGAKEVTSLDISTHALEIAISNAKLNSYSGTHSIIAGDAFKTIENLIKEKNTFDIVVIDPPSFAKKQSEIEIALKQYSKLARLSVQLVNKKGILVLASCSSRIKADEFFNAIEKEFSKSNRHLKPIDKTYHDIDHPITFPEGAYLKCGYYLVN